LREDATEAGCEIVVDEKLPTLRMDAMGIELVLRAIVSAVLRGAEPQSSITIGPAKTGESSVSIAVRLDTPVSVAALAPELALAEQIAKRIAGRVWVEDAVYLELPFSVAHEGENVAGAHE
jgi:hypothetical protein